MPDAAGTPNSPAVSPAGGSATTQEAARLAGAEDDVPTGKDRGAIAPKDAPPTPAGGDFAGGKQQKPQGLQAEPATFTPTGTVPAGFGPSPSGPVPESVAVLSAEEAQQSSRLADRHLTEQDVEQLGSADLRAIGTQRGYKLNDLAGARSTRSAFLAAQADDDRFHKPKSKK